MRISSEQLQMLVSSRIGLLLGKEGITTIVEKGESRKRSSGGRFFQEGDTAAGMFLVLKGKVKLLRMTRDGRETLLHIAEAPSMIAEAALFLGVYPATAEAIEDTELLFLSKDSAFQLIEQNGVFARWLFENMTLWLKRLVQRIEELTTSDATSRLARYLIDLNEKSSPGISLKAPTVVLPVRKGELAKLMNMQLPSLSRIFRKMQDDGVIEVSGKSIILKNLPALRRMTLPPLM